jgi:predicted DNA-binding transcriptional regulator AlpA
MKLASYTEIGAMLGVSRQRAEQLPKEHKDFPKPLDRLSCGTIWRRSSVEKWAEKHGRQVQGAGA